MNKQKEKNEMHSSKVRNILQQRPIWLVRNGIAIIFIVLIIMLAIATFINLDDNKTFIDKIFIHSHLL